MMTAGDRELIMEFDKINDIEGKQNPLLQGCIAELVYIGGGFSLSIPYSGDIVAPQADCRRNRFGNILIKIEF